MTTKNKSSTNELKDQTKHNLTKATKGLINWKEELTVWATVITALTSVIQLLITLIRLGQGK